MTSLDLPFCVWKLEMNTRLNSPISHLKITPRTKVALLTLSVNSLNKYYGYLSWYLKFCSDNKHLLFDAESIEKFILQMYHSRDKRQNPEGFRSAVNLPDPTPPLARMLIKAFNIDCSKKEKRRFLKEDLKKFFEF